MTTREGGHNGCEDEEDKCYNERVTFEPGVGVVLCLLVCTALNRQLAIASFGIRVGVEYAEGSESPLQVGGCRDVIQDRFGSSLALLLDVFDVYVKGDLHLLMHIIAFVRLVQARQLSVILV